MNERLRTEYLTALGVTSYMPRFRLPLAPEPTQAPLPPPVETSSIAPASSPAAALLAETGAGAANVPPPESAASRPAPNQSAPVQIPTDVGRVIGSITAETKIVPTEPARVTAPEQPVEPFVLSCWWLGQELLAVDSRVPGAALPVESLFGNIARALGWHGLDCERDRLKWPPAENPFTAAAGADDARDICGSWLQAACSRKPVKSIWLMGDAAQQFCAPIALEQPVNDWQGVQVIAMPSLTTLLQQPLQKRALWQLLRRVYPEQTRA
ncbi:hypothetical protein [Microbulbifer sp.]|uniref:hypothetical protein n=1 Tax=Microbulbifer sp. TaxID=1908541 RepID=UPI00258DBCBE|nr:hypothetical protein [Microbulbifer sp.]